jgi:hypothetical protein
MFLSAAFSFALIGSTGQITNRGGQVWAGHGGNPSHTAISPFPSRKLDAIAWQVPIDLTPRYSGNSLLTHYGEPCITNLNVVITAVKQNLNDGFKVRAYKSTGTALWSENTDYSVPPQGWIPSCSPTLVFTRGTLADPMVAYPMGGGRVAFRSAHNVTATPVVHAFYGDSTFSADQNTFLNNVRICTPLSTSLDGSIYFGFAVLGGNSANLTSGLAKIDKDGNGSWISAATLSGDNAVNQVKYNCAPGLDAKSQNLYITTNTGSFGRGYLTRVDPSTMTVLGRVRLLDPRNGSDASIDNEGTSSPLVGPDGDVYQGTLPPNNHCRGILLHFSKDLTQTKIPGAFGWDDTPSVVPSYMVGGYTGTSSYLLFCKYNNYAGCGGTGANRVAVVDPNASETDTILNMPTMKVADSVLSPTPDSEFPTTPGAVREWCVNSAAIDVPKSCVIVSAEDGVLYRWNLQTHSITESIRLTPGIGEAYTPTAIGPDGRIYAMSNAILFAVGIQK